MAWFSSRLPANRIFAELASGMLSYMPALPARLLSLPEEWSLLSFTDSGEIRDSNQAAVGCAVAELGELALRRKLLVRSRKFNVFGITGFRLSHCEIQVIDTGRTGLPWADEMLADLEHRSDTEQMRLSLRQWLRQRREAFFLHRAALAERGVLRRAPGTRSALRRSSPERHFPDPTARNALIAELRAAGSGQGQLDEHMLFLSDLVTSSLLHKDLGIELRMSHRLDRGRGAGTFGTVPEDLRDTSAVLAAFVPKNARYEG